MNASASLARSRNAATLSGPPPLRRAIAARLVMLGFLEIGQYSFVRPAAVAELGPGVVVERIAAHVDHAVDRARSAEGLAARDWDRAAVQFGLGLGGKPPIVARTIEELHEARRDADPHRIIGWPGFQQQDV